MKLHFLILVIFQLFFSCSNLSPAEENIPEKTESISVNKPKGDLFEDDSLSFDAQKDKIFRPILNNSSRSDSKELLRKLQQSYQIQFEPGLELTKLYSVKMYGCKDSIWVMECSVPKDSICKPHGRKQQFFFDAKGHLIHTDKAATIKWINFKEKNGPLLMTLNSDCNGTGYHHFYKFDNAELLDIFNVLLENTPATFDTNLSDDIVYQPQELELKMEDKNGDKIKDISFQGMKQIYKNGNFIKSVPIEYVFIYQPGEDWFLLKSLAK
jgi:hypothetical protein